MPNSAGVVSSKELELELMVILRDPYAPVLFL